MGQEQSQALGLQRYHQGSATESPASDKHKTLHKPSLAHTTTDIGRLTDTDMPPGIFDTDAEMSSPEQELPSEMVGSPTDDTYPGDAADLNTSDGTHVVSDTFEEQHFNERSGRTKSPSDDTYPGNADDLNTSDGVQVVSDISEEQHFNKRELRPKTELKKPGQSAWVDTDKTGDFDPRAESCKARSRKKTKLSHLETHDCNSEERTSEPESERIPEQPKSLIAYIRFSSSSGRDAFSELCASLKTACDPFTEGYQLRKRKKMSDGSFHETICAQPTGVLVFDSERPDDYTNHPVGRGCFNCIEHRSRCSLLDNEQSWPCDECEENDDDCQLYKEPELKMACTHCQYLGKRQKWLVCSFDYDRDPSSHRGPCSQCQDDGHRPCIAGPQPGHVRTRIRIGSDEKPYENARISQKATRIKTCRQCLESRRPCSFASRSSYGDGDPCTACDMSGEMCEPLGRKVHVPQNRRQQLPPISAGEELEDFGMNQDIITISSSPPRTPVNSQPRPGPGIMSDSTTETSKAPSGTIITVRTKFCHPIRFDYRDETIDGSDPCHFCSCAYYSIIGLEERVTEVIEWDDRRQGWEEIGGGHRGEDTKTTQVCSTCTMSRMKIMVCSHHELKRISKAGGRRDLQAAFEKLLDSGQTAGQTWCSVCCNLAAWKCCVEQRIEQGKGCGLALCEPCHTDLEICDGSLETLLQQLEDEPSYERPLGLRADYGLLKRDGLLMAFLKSTGSE